MATDIDALANTSECDDDDKKLLRKGRQAVLLHAAALFDINECGLDWITNAGDKSLYDAVLIRVIVGEIPGILGDEFDDDVDYEANLRVLHRQMLNELDGGGRKDVKFSLDWWRDVKNSTFVTCARENCGWSRFSSISLVHIYLFKLHQHRLNASSVTRDIGKVFAGKQQDPQ